MARSLRAMTELFGKEILEKAKQQFQIEASIDSQNNIR
jgi:hypothetical protein